ncbi:MAG: pantoate--beta-alanine ligase [Candidatus Hydrogenedentota bacterium]
MELLHTPAEMRAWSLRHKCAGRSIGFVPTMGALHEGHRSLMRVCRERDDVAVLSVFVNPAQFAPGEDYDRYPRTWEADKADAEEIGFDAIFVPDAKAMYPEDYSTYVTAEGVSGGLCTRTRPHFFRGVATVCAKLFNAVLPDRAYFGQKDGQQCAVVKRMARDLDMQVEIVALPTVREPDGLAMSSRNKYLTEEDRPRALSLSKSLFHAKELMEAGERNADTLKQAVREGMRDVDIDYVELVNADTIQPVDTIEGTVMLAVAANVGTARLIDNILFTVPKENGQ